MNSRLVISKLQRKEKTRLTPPQKITKDLKGMKNLTIKILFCFLRKHYCLVSQASRKEFSGSNYTLQSIIEHIKMEMLPYLLQDKTGISHSSGKSMSTSTGLCKRQSHRQPALGSNTDLPLTACITLGKSHQL